MAGINTVYTRVLAAAFVVAIAVGVGCAASGQMGGGGGTDKRKLTTIQTSKQDAVEVRFLNLPFGEKTFGYLSVGGDDYYSNRTWPFAHLTLSKTASWQGHDLAPGDYVLYITPKSASAPMSLTVASFKPNDKGTFLVPGDVFVETPKDAVPVATVPITFDKKDPSVDHLDIAVNKVGDGADVVLHYGDHWLTQHLTVK